MSNNPKLLIRFSKTSEKVEIDYYLKTVVRTAILKTLEAEKVKHSVEVSVTFCDNKYIRSLNKEYRNKDKATDVLSFPMYTPDDIAAAPSEEELLLGDIVISLERAKTQAAELGNSFVREVAFLTIHSMLHLLGYDHERSVEDDEVQCSRQREIINTFEI